MSDADIAVLGAATLVEGVPVWQANVPVANDVDDVEPLGEVDAYQALGFASMPAAKDDGGHAEAVVLRNVAGRDAICIGGRDTRSAKIQGKLGPGDTAIFATGPEKDAVAQVQCKAKKRQVLLATENTKSETMLFLLDGKNNKGQWVANGAIAEVNEKGEWIFTSAQGAGIIISDKIYFVGEISLPGMLPGMALQQGPATGSPGGAGALPTFAVMGVGK
jgi:hypothetical protein